MKVRNIYYSSSFKKSVKKYSAQRKKIEKAIRKFILNPFETSLKTHKLSGRDKECWAFWVTYFIRIKFIFLTSEEVLFLDIGPHPKIYK